MFYKVNVTEHVELEKNHYFIYIKPKGDCSDRHLIELTAQIPGLVQNQIAF